MTPQTLDLIIAGIAGVLRVASGIVKNWTGGPKLASELERMAADADAFRSDPVFKQEIESERLGETW